MAWIKSDTKAILAIHDHVITNNARLDITHNDKVCLSDSDSRYNNPYLQDTWTLTLRSVQTKDRGPYMCQVNSTPVKSQVCVLPLVWRIIIIITSENLPRLLISRLLFPPGLLMMSPALTWRCRREDQ